MFWTENSMVEYQNGARIQGLGTKGLRLVPDYRFLIPFFPSR